MLIANSSVGLGDFSGPRPAQNSAPLSAGIPWEGMFVQKAGRMHAQMLLLLLL